MLGLSSTNQSTKVENIDLDVPLLYLYSYVGKPGKYHQHIIEVHYLQPVECCSYKLKRTVDPKWRGSPPPAPPPIMEDWNFDNILQVKKNTTQDVDISAKIKTVHELCISQQ